MADNTVRILFGLIEGQTTFFQVKIHTNDSVLDLKELVFAKKPYTLDVDPDELLLFKLNQRVSLVPADSLADRIEARGDISSFTDLLVATDRVLNIFPKHPPRMDLHFIVRVAPDRHAGKRARLDHPVSEEVRQNTIQLADWSDFRKKLWKKGLEHFKAQCIETRSIQLDGATVSFNVLKMHKAFRLNVTGLLIRDEWDITWSRAEATYAEGVRNLIIIGQTGIGKTLSLFYILSKRLAQGLPTLFQTEPDEVWFFDKSGVRLLSSRIYWAEIQGVSKEDSHWALVDSNRRVRDPAPVIYDNGSPFFIVQAASPRDDRWGWAKYHGTSRHFYSKPFSMGELLGGNLLQPTPAKEDDIRDFYIKYGPSARNCYDACHSLDEMEGYRTKLNLTIGKMSWDSIERVIASADFTPQFNTEPYLVVLIEPADDKRLRPKANVIRRTVMRLLWQEHGVQLNRKAKELFHVFSQHRESSPTAGWIYEGQIHQLLEKGINVPLDPMAITVNNRQDAVNDTHVASKVGSGRWVSQPMEYVPFTANDRALKIESFHYYVPVDPTHATYDSFTFEFVPRSMYDGPVLNPDNMNTLTMNELVNMSSIAVFTVFQATKASEHDLNAKGLNYVVALAKHGGMKAMAIRYIAVIPAGHEVKIKSPVGWRGKLGMYAMQVANYVPL